MEALQTVFKPESLFPLLYEQHKLQNLEILGFLAFMQIAFLANNI